MLKRTLIIPIMILMLTGISIAGEGRKPAEKRKTEKPETRKRRTQQMPAEEPPAQTEPYLIGEAKVTIRSDQHPPIKIGMAASGITIIEFPATDKFFAVHPPRNGDWVEVEKSPSMKVDTHLVLRAGKDLNAAAGPVASISAQMRSGLIVTFWVYPTKSISQQTYRLIVSYDRDEIVAARKKAGLAVNLGEGEEREPAQAAASDDAISKPATTAQLPPPIPAPAPRHEEKATPVESANLPSSQPDEPAPVRSENRLKELRGMLSDAVANPKGFKKWTSPTNGLTVSTRICDLDEKTSVYLVAVKNVENESLRLLRDHPELVIESRDNKGKVIQLTPIKKIYFESTTSNNVIPARATVYFAVAYKPPVLGKQQRVRVTVGQINAADDPVIAGLPANQ